MQYRDVDRKAQEKAEARIGARREAWTPGEWTLDFRAGAYLVRAPGRVVAQIVRNDAEDEANAHLLVEAKRLAAALAALVSPNHTPETYDAAMLNARNVLAEATGEKP